MRLHILSDLHLEFSPFTPPQVDADVIVLAGDIAQGYEARDWVADHFPDKPVLYVLGNHEYYNYSLPELAVTLRRMVAGTNIHLLENEAAEIAGHRFLGCTLWTDFKLHGTPVDSRAEAAAWMADYRCIDFDPSGRRLTAKNTEQLHAASRAWLESELPRGDPARTVVITHHAPSRRSTPPQHERSLLNPAFCSPLDELVEQSGIPLWIHGHTHHNVDYVLGKTRVLSNQRGYPEELSPGFQGDRVVTL